MSIVLVQKWGVDDSEVIFDIAIVVSSPANYLYT